MEKLKLNLDELKVESFDTTPMQGDQLKGTVYGNSGSVQGPTCQVTCQATLCYTCSCAGCGGGATENTCQGSTCECW